MYSERTDQQLVFIRTDKSIGVWCVFNGHLGEACKTLYEHLNSCVHGVITSNKKNNIRERIRNSGNRIVDRLKPETKRRTTRNSKLYEIQGNKPN